jgi:hypothetical protein
VRYGFREAKGQTDVILDRIAMIQNEPILRRRLLKAGLYSIGLSPSANHLPPILHFILASPYGDRRWPVLSRIQPTVNQPSQHSPQPLRSNQRPSPQILGLLPREGGRNERGQQLGIICSPLAAALKSSQVSHSPLEFEA